MQSPNVFFPKLKETRIHRGYTQKDMQLLLGYRSESRYAQYENGDRKPNVVEALLIAKVLGETVEYLFVTQSSKGEAKGSLKGIGDY